MKKIKAPAIIGLVAVLFIGGCAADNSRTDSGSSGWSYFDANDSSLTGESTSPGLPELTEKSGLSDYLVYAALNNSGLEAAFNRWKAALQQIPQVRSLPDPRFTYRYFIEQVETRVGAQQQAFAIAQMFPWFGKLKLRANAATQEAGAAKQRYEAVKLKLFFQVKNAYYEYYYLWKEIGIIKENTELVRNFESVARARYKVSSTGQSDVIRAQVELGKLEDRLKTLQDLRSSIVARLNATLNRPAEAPLAWPKQIHEEDIALSDRQILGRMAEHNPELAALEYEIAKSRTQISLAKKDYYPDITLGINYIDTADSISAKPPKDNGEDPVIAMFSINLPIWKEKLDAGLRQARYKYFAAKRNKTEKLNTLSARLKLVLFQFRDAERKIDLYRDTLLPKAVESVKATNASFRAGDNTFLELIDSQRIMLEFELTYQRALSNKAQRLAELEMLTGRQIPRIKNAHQKIGEAQDE